MDYPPGFEPRFEVTDAPVLVDLWFDTGPPLTAHDAYQLLSLSDQCFTLREDRYSNRIQVVFDPGVRTEYIREFIDHYTSSVTDDGRLLSACRHPEYVAKEEPPRGLAVWGPDATFTKREIDHIFRSFPGYLYLVNAAPESSPRWNAIFTTWHHAYEARRRLSGYPLDSENFQMTMEPRFALDADEWLAEYYSNFTRHFWARANQSIM